MTSFTAHILCVYRVTAIVALLIVCRTRYTAARQQPALLCGGRTQYCPVGAVRPYPVLKGYYATGLVEGSNDFLQLLFQSPSSSSSPSLAASLSSSSLAARAASLQLPSPTLASHEVYTSQTICPAGSYCIGGIKYSCPAGRYCATAGLVEPTGDCAAGYYCPAGSWLEYQVPCGPPSVYCPQGAFARLQTPAGYYSTREDEGNAEAARRIETELSWDRGMSAVSPCIVGYYCQEGIRIACTLGYYCSKTGLTSPNGKCQAGYYCPKGSQSANESSCGDMKAYLLSHNRRDDDDNNIEVDVIYGDFNKDEYDEEDAAYLQLVSSLNGSSLYCPEGSWRPNVVQRGYYTVGDIKDSPGGTTTNGHIATKTFHVIGINVDDDSNKNVSGIDGDINVDDDGSVFQLPNQISQALCPAGRYCSGGVQRLCPPGTFGSEWGLFNDTCSGECPAGLYCPRGSLFGSPCGDPGLYCPPGSVVPLPVDRGFVSVRDVEDDKDSGGSAGGGNGEGGGGGINDDEFAEGLYQTAQRLAVKGSYADAGIERQCPPGSYGATEGMAIATCSGQCRAGYYCPAGSISRRQIACGAPGRFCPQGSAAPHLVTPGYYTSSVKEREGVELEAENEVKLGIGLEEAEVADSTSKLTATSINDDVKLKVRMRMLALALLEECPPGYFRNDSARTAEGGADEVKLLQYFAAISPTATVSKPPAPCELCPYGTYKAQEGDDLSLCLPCESHTSVSLPGRVACNCYRLAGGDTNFNSLYFNTSSGVCQNVTSSTKDYLMMISADDVSLEGSIYARSLQLPCPPGYWCHDGWILPCQAGRYGNSERMTSPQCTGNCQAGYYCPVASTSATQAACGHAGVYCPTGSAAPLFVDVGYYSNEDRHEAIRYFQIECPVGYYCPGATDGGGRRYKCPPGTYGRTTRLSTPDCSGLCDGGYLCPAGSSSAQEEPCGGISLFCPPGSFKPTPVQMGYYTVNTFTINPGGKPVITGDLASRHRGGGGASVGGGGGGGDAARDFAERTRSAAVRCPPGSYCVDGVESICPPGTFGWDYGLTSVTQCVTCSAGYYCESGANKPRDCGDASVYCPAGVSKPIAVAAGFYSFGDMNRLNGSDDAYHTSRMVQQRLCEAGYYCIRGAKYECSAGRFGLSEGLTGPQCSGLCPAGSFCPTATGKPVPCPDYAYSGTGAWECNLCPGESRRQREANGKRMSGSNGDGSIVARGSDVTTTTTITAKTTAQGGVLAARCKTSRQCCTAVVVKSIAETAEEELQQRL